jgi:hypothetical protein
MEICETFSSVFCDFDFQIEAMIHLTIANNEGSTPQTPKPAFVQDHEPGFATLILTKPSVIEQILADRTQNMSRKMSTVTRNRLFLTYKQGVLGRTRRLQTSSSPNIVL